MLKYPVWLIDFMKILCHGKWFSYYSLWQTLCLCCRCVCAHGGGVWCGGAALAPTGHQPAAAYVDRVLPTPLRLREQRPPRLQHSLRSRSLADCVLPTPLCLREQRPPWLQHSLRSRTLADRSKVIIKTWIRWSLHTSLGTQQCVLGNSDSVKLILLFPRVTNLWNAAYFKVKLSDCCID